MYCRYSLEKTGKDNNTIRLNYKQCLKKKKKLC